MRINYSRIKGVIVYGSMSIYFRIAKNQSGSTFAVGAFVKPDPAPRFITFPGSRGFKGD
ncbi:hypothetical protein ES705_48406 [subsurface metagenome]